MSNKKLIKNKFSVKKNSENIFEYFRGKVSSNKIIFLQETHSSEEALKKRQDYFQGQVFFSHGTTNSFCVMIGFLENKKR